MPEPPTKTPPSPKAPDPKAKVPAGPAGVALVAALLVAMLAKPGSSEGGRRLDVYLDSVGIPTSCAGIIGPEVNRRWAASGHKTKVPLFTDAECQGLEQAYVARQITAMQACVPAKVREELTVGELLAFAHWAYNTGTGAYCGNTGLHRALVAGDHRAACHAMGQWTFVTLAGKRVNCRLPQYQRLCGGIPKRRDLEVGMCLNALP